MPIKQRIIMLGICAKTMQGEAARKFLEETALTLEGLSCQYNNLFQSAKETLEDNLHLTDGDNCTLLKLRNEMVKQGYDGRANERRL